MSSQGAKDARAELRSWYVDGLRPKLARAARSGAVDPGAAAALDAEVRKLLDLRSAQEDVAA
jgi:hypothetical protein